MSSARGKGLWYLPGLLYDLAFGGMFRGLRRRVARAVEAEALHPWLDVCCGTGAQLRGPVPGARPPEESVPDRGSTGAPDRAVFGLDLSFGFVRYAAARAPAASFVCADAAKLPFRDGSLRAVSVSFGLHDKGPETRAAILAEARRVLTPDGRLIAVDFEDPWSLGSKAGRLFVRAIERLAGGEHHRNGKEFVRRGGLRGLLRENGFVEVSRHDVATGSLGVVTARADGDRPCLSSSAE